MDAEAQREQERAEALAAYSVSRETADRLDRYIALLLERQQRMNLIAPSTIPRIWTRHVADSLQLLPLAQAASRWVDMGSGAGFPGLVIACALADTGAQVHLIESVRKKAAFLEEVASTLALPVTVWPDRIESVLPRLADSVDVVTARALAPLDRLLACAEPLLKDRVPALLMKGQDAEAELAEARKSWTIEAELVPSRTDPTGRIVVVRSATRIASARKLR
jgi:16S rRNA (guanine527-N7)-methyltransferase